MDHFNKLTPAEAERLALLSEEMGEVQQVIGKILRHGYESTHPSGGPTNRQLLEKELGDVIVANMLMTKSGDVDADRIGDATIEKRFTLPNYLHHNSHLFTENN